MMQVCAWGTRALYRICCAAARRARGCGMRPAAVTAFLLADDTSPRCGGGAQRWRAGLAAARQPKSNPIIDKPIIDMPAVCLKLTLGRGWCS